MPVKTSVHKAFEHIRQRILGGDLGPGEVISEAGLARELGLSRTPVGEALRELAGLGLVEQVPRYGTIVRRINRRDLVELYQLREALEPYAAGLAAQRVTADELEKLQLLCQRIESFVTEMESEGREKLEGQSLREFLAADMAFHTLVIHAAGNRRVARLVHESHLLTQLFGTRRLVHEREIVIGAVRFHTQILAALRQGDAQAAREVAAEHIRASLAHTLENLDQERSDDLATLGLSGDVREELDRVGAAPASGKRKRAP